jgi:hypothetical protein
MQNLIAENTATAREAKRDGRELGKARVRIIVEVEGDGEVRDEALGRIHSVLRRSADSFAQIAAVDLRDQKVEAEEMRRLEREPLDPNRGHVAVGAGTKDPSAVQVLRGTVIVNKKSISAPRGDR